MRAGNLRNYVIIQQPIESQDSNLELITTWSTFATVWAEILPLVGREYWASRQTVSEVTGKMKMRYIPGLTTKMKIIDGAKTYDIEAVIDIENRHAEIVLLVKES